MRTCRNCFFVLLCLFLTGCPSSMKYMIRQNAVLKNSKGAVFLKSVITRSIEAPMTKDKTIIPSPEMIVGIKNLETKELVYHQVFDRQGWLAIQLDPGNYLFMFVKHFRTRTYEDTRTEKDRWTLPVNAEFTVREGTVNFLGTYVFVREDLGNQKAFRFEIRWDQNVNEVEQYIAPRYRKFRKVKIETPKIPFDRIQSGEETPM